MKIKTRVVDFLNMLAEGKIKPNTQINYGGLTYIVDYPNLCGIYEECAEPKRENSLFSRLDICALNYIVEIIEDEEEIDIQSIEELARNPDVRINNKEISASDIFYTITNIVMSINDLKNKQNESLKAVKQLDKKVNSIEQK